MPFNRALEGITVVALEQAVAAPYCTSRLADAGARVIKVERGGGETARHYDQAVHGVSAYFAWLNRGKESVVLDLKQADDLELLRTMLGTADVLVQNLVPGALGRMGLDAQELSRINPALIGVSIVGYGADTSYAERRAYDMLVQAESGLCAITGTRDEPVKVGVSVADIATGMNAHAAILEALISRSKTGRGCAIEIAMFDSVADWMNVPLLHYTLGGRQTPREGLAHASIYPYGAFQCLDAEIVVVVQNPAEWQRFCEHVLRNPGLIGNPRFADNPARVRNRVALHREISETFCQLPFDNLVRRIEDAGLPWARCSSVADLAAHPALQTIHAKAGGRLFRLAAPPLHPDAPVSEVPILGEHTDAVRAEFGVPPEG